MAVLIVLLVTVLVALLALLYKWSVAKYDTFTQRGVPHASPLPLLGNVPPKGVVGRLPFLQFMIEQHLRYTDHKIYGVYAMRDPLFFIKDAALIKAIGIRDFDYFVNHKAIHNNLQESILSKSLISLKDLEWRQVRHTLTPTFTSSKMRVMFELIHACSVQAINGIGEKLERSASLHSDGIELEMKDVFTRFANDCIATVAFGLQVNSFKQRSNEFYTVGQALTQFSAWSMLKAVLYSIMPNVMKKLNISVLKKEHVDYFKSLVFDAIRQRKQQNFKRPDLIQLLMQAQEQITTTTTTNAEEKPEGLTDEDVLAQCLFFFFAGFETISITLCFATYELCMNPLVQSKLFEEISDMQNHLEGKPLDYNDLNKMDYLDMVVSETLRKWPTAIATDRECAKDYDLRDENDEVVLSLRKGEVVQIPIFALHHDPENFPEPQEFRPERFSDEHNSEIKPYTYLPFGLGPRSCIGNRLAVMELKLMIYNLVLDYNLLPATKTVTNMLQSIVGFRLQPKELFWLKCVPRKTN